MAMKMEAFRNHTHCDHTHNLMFIMNEYTSQNIDYYKFFQVFPLKGQYHVFTSQKDLWGNSYIFIVS